MYMMPKSVMPSPAPKHTPPRMLGVKKPYKQRAIAGIAAVQGFKNKHHVKLVLHHALLAESNKHKPRAALLCFLAAWTKSQSELLCSV
jgi:hypothetical protein